MFQTDVGRKRTGRKRLLAAMGMLLLTLDAAVVPFPVLAAGEPGSVSGNDVSVMSETGEKEPAIRQSKQEPADIILPARLEVAFNPLRLAVDMGDGSYSTEQVLSGNYEIQNQGSADFMVEAAVTVEDLNGGQILFVDSPEAAENAEEGVYAIYLAAASLRDGEMFPLREGENKIVLHLPRGGLTGFTFQGVMNGNAEWHRLAKGVRFSVVYTYETLTDGDSAGMEAEPAVEPEQETTGTDAAEAAEEL